MTIAQDLVRNDPSMARAAKEAAKVLLKVDGDDAEKPQRESKNRVLDKRQLSPALSTVITREGG
jgi:hypothetical protein